MDIYKAIVELREEKKRLDRAIAALEQNGSPGAGQTRHRAWDSSARQAAAARMKKYWDLRKQASHLNGADQSHSVKPPSTDSA